MYSLPVDYTKLTPFERRKVRLQYIEKQNNVCMFCRNYLDDEPTHEVLSRKINWNLFPTNLMYLLLRYI